MPNFREKVQDKVALILIDFLHDVKAVNWTARNEIDIDENNYGELAKMYAKQIERFIVRSLTSKSIDKSTKESEKYER
ncbi:hypothetical protein HY384_02015 [Candidatus Daviesbacteria bacterium]|nr:hypothetical protein [Candidatus Daviesbacteria bacterium]